MLAARFHPSMEPFSARLGVMVGLLALLALVLSVLPGHAEKPAGIASARSVIERQIEAFRADDGPAAYAHAAPTVQALFPSPAAFMQMVRRGYAPVYRPTHYRFEPARIETPDRLVQPVRIEWRGGPPVIAVYLMGRQAGGDWKIEGVMLAKDDRVGA